MSANPTIPLKVAAKENHQSINQAAAGSDEAVIFLHLPKTAGTTVNRLIEWEYPLSEMYLDRSRLV